MKTMCDTATLKATPAQLGYLVAVIEEFPKLSTIAARQRSKRMIFAALCTMQPANTYGFKTEHMRSIQHSINLEDVDSFYLFYFNKGS